MNLEGSYVASRSIQSQVQNMIIKIEEMYDWSNDTLLAELTKFLKEEMCSKGQEH